MSAFVIAVLALALAGCAVWPGAGETAKTPLHAESGIGVTVGKVPVLGVGVWGSQSSSPGIVIHQYSYQASPTPTTPSGIPAQPPGPPQPVPYETVYQPTFPPGAFDDPTLVVFQNASERATLTVAVSGQAPITLAPGQSTASLHLDMGEHGVVITGTVPTGLGPRALPKQERMIRIDPRGRAQIIPLRE